MVVLCGEARVNHERSKEARCTADAVAVLGPALEAQTPAFPPNFTGPHSFASNRI